jgi:hypothetical protein
LPIPTRFSSLFSKSLFPNSHGVTSFADPHPLSPSESYRCKNSRAVGSLYSPASDSSSPRVRHFRHRDEFPVTITPLDSALTNCDVHKSFRIRSYKNMGCVPQFFPFWNSPGNRSCAEILSSRFLMRAPLPHLSPLLPLSPFAATLPKTPDFKSFACHTSEKTGGCPPLPLLSSRLASQEAS